MKALKWLLIVLLLAGVGAGAYLLLPQKHRTPSGASLLTPDTFLFLRMPNPSQAREDWKTTALYKIWSEPEVQQFLGKSVDALRKEYRENVGANPYMRLARNALALAQGEFFLALPDLSDRAENGAPKNQRSAGLNLPPLIVGVDVKEKRADADRWLAEVKTQVSKLGGKFSEDIQNHAGISYTRWTSGTTTICQTYLGTLLVATSKEQTMQGMIDRYNDGKAPSLSVDARFLNAAGKMPSKYAAFVYCNPKPVVTLLKGFALFMPQLQSGMRNLDALQAISYSTTLTNGGFKDVLFVDAPAAKRGEMGSESQPTEKKSLVLTSNSSLFYSVQSLDLARTWDKMYEQLQNSQVAKIQEAMFQLEKFNREHDCDFPKEFLANVGPELAVSLGWEQAAQFPEFFLAFQVRDKAKATAALDKLWALRETLSQQVGVQPFVDEVYEGETIRSLQTPWISPNYTLGNQFFLLTMQTDTARRLLTKLKKHDSKTLADNAAYQQLGRELPAGGSSYSYLDSRNLFSRTYNSLRPILKDRAATIAGANQFVDLNKMPKTETISQHLQPSGAAQVVDKDGFTTVIISPIGMPVVAVGAAVGAGVAIVQKFPNFPMR